MEKCSLCVQRIQLAKDTALQGKRELADGDIQTACQQACPTQAIIFGDLKDPNSAFPRCIATSGTTRCWKTWARVRISAISRKSVTH